MQTPKSRRCSAQGWLHEWLCLPLRTSFHSSPKLYKLPVTESSFNLYDEWKRYNYFLGGLGMAQFRTRDQVNIVVSVSNESMGSQRRAWCVFFTLFVFALKGQTLVDKLTLLGMQTWALYPERIPAIRPVFLHLEIPPWLAFAHLSLP